jgi:HEAT repeat protein
MSDENWMVREVAAETMGSNKLGAQAADGLIVRLDDPFWQVRLKAVRSLGRLKIPQATMQIVPSLVHEQANLRKEAAAALGEIADAAALPYLEQVADDPDPEVRKNARWAIDRIRSLKESNASF